MGPRSATSRWAWLIAAALAIAACSSEVADSPPSKASDSGAGTGGSGAAGGSGGIAGNGGGAGTGGSSGGGSGTAGDSGSAGTMTAGTGGSAMTDGSAGTGPCGAEGVVLCDGFESAAVGGPPGGDWVVELQNAQESLTVDDSRAARGKHSVRIRTGSGYERALLATTRGFPFAQNTFYARALVYTTTVPAANAHFTLLTGVGKLQGASEKTFVRLGGQFGILMANYYGFNASDQPQYSSSVPGNYSDGVQMPRDRWACLEVGFLGATNELRVWLDDAEITRLHVTNWNPPPPNLAWSPAYERAEIGFEAYGGQGDIDIWYDEIAIGKNRIGCPK
jgi:hypothetical protein